MSTFIDHHGRGPSSNSGDEGNQQMRLFAAWLQGAGAERPDEATAELAAARERARLRVWAALVMSWLVVLALASLGFTVAFLADGAPFGIAEPHAVIVLCVLGGTLGSCVAALLSAADRTAHGWELSSGAKYPTDENKDKFVGRMVPFFMVRPFLGSAVGLLVYAGLRSGSLIATEASSTPSFSREGLLFFALLSGLFAKTLLEKLKVTFDVLFGKVAK